jgi:plasmid stabilization system protein ParE
MISSIKILTEASDDIKEITSWYHSISPTLSARFVAQVYEGFENISANPDAWFNVTKKVRRYHLSGFPYLVSFLNKAKTFSYLQLFMKDETLNNGRRK